MKRISPTSIAAVLACGIVASFLLLHAIAAEPEYELVQPVSVDAGGQPVQLPAGQTVMMMGTPDASGNVMVRVALPNGSLTIAQIPAASIRLRPPMASSIPATPAPAPLAATPAPAPPAAAAASAPAPAASPAAPPAQAGALISGPATASFGAPDFGPNVLIFDPSMTDAQAKLDAISEQQKSNGSAQFNNGRYALLFKPGTYDWDVKIGFYEDALGLGPKPDAVAIKSVHCNFYGNVTQTFWRAMENMEITGNECYWGVSQGCSFRRIHVTGGLKLNSEGWASGGFLADCKVEGGINSGSQQQWVSRNAELGRWSNAVWNMVFVGVPKAPTNWPSYTAVDKTPVIAEKPYLFIDPSGHYFVMVPALRMDSQGESWSSGTTAGTPIPIGLFYLAHAGKDTAASINAALASGKNLILTPGIYHLEAAIEVRRPDTVVLGMGYATLIPDRGTPAMKIADVNGVKVARILFQAGTANSPSLLQVGEPGSKVPHAADPTIIYDIFARVGGAGPGSCDSMVTINSSNVIGDNAWLWRADHGAGAGWTTARNKNGIIVNGDNVTYYGLAVEHTQEYQTMWNGNGGRVYFYQSEIPYDVPDQNTWRPGSKDGWASYKVADKVTTHEAWGLGIYSLFNAGTAVLQNAYETPAAPGIKMHHLNSINLGGKAPGSGIAHVINGTGGNAVGGSKFMRATLADWP